MSTSGVNEFIRLFESGQDQGIVFAETANDLAESLGGTRCIIAHTTDQMAGLFYLIALVAAKASAQYAP